MKEEIIKLRQEGKSYREISNLIGCAKSTVIYHCNDDQKLKYRDRQRKRRKDDVIGQKLYRYRYKKEFFEKIRDFQRRDKSKVVPIKEYNFNIENLLNKIGENPKCYLSGVNIDLQNGKSYHLDHIIPASRGGKNSLDNVGILNSTINKMKHDLTPDEFISKCIQILEYQGYEIRKRDE